MTARKLLLVPLLAAGALIQGCTQAERTESVTLTMVYNDEMTYQLNYGERFAKLHPEINVKIIPFNIFEENPDRWWSIVHDEKPDVIAMNSLQDYRALSAEGGLQELGVVMKQEKYDTDAFIPDVINILRSNGGGSLYGLTPGLSSFALFYNKGLFDQYQIPHPTSSMTWDDMLQLADRFPAEPSDEDNRIYGYYNSGYYEMANFGGLIEWMGRAAGLSLVDFKSDQVLIGSPEWSAVFERCIDSLRRGTVHVDEDIASQLFSKGRAAMRIGGLEVVGQMDQYRSEHPDAPAVDWGVVQLPHEPVGRNFSPWVLHTIYGINADSPQQKAAWELIKFIHSEEQLREEAQWGLVTRTALNKDRDGRSLAPFWKMPQTAGSDSWEEVPMAFRMKLRYLGEDVINNVLSGSLMLDEALQKLQSKAQEEWLRTKITENATNHSK